MVPGGRSVKTDGPKTPFVEVGRRSRYTIELAVSTPVQFNVKEDGENKLGTKFTISPGRSTKLEKGGLDGVIMDPLLFIAYTTAPLKEEPI